MHLAQVPSEFALAFRQSHRCGVISGNSPAGPTGQPRTSLHRHDAAWGRINQGRDLAPAADKLFEYVR